MKKNAIRTGCVCIFLLCFMAVRAEQKTARFVNPLIGTGKSLAKTKWGNYGGTYPGAVCPWGMVQLTPETSIRPGEKGYYYEDTNILSFSCVNHRSGFPNGSAGSIHFLFEQKQFSHSKEEVAAGYYGVTFDEGDKVELTATTRTGMFRYTPVQDTYKIGLTGAGKITSNDKDELYTSAYNCIIQFSEPWDHLTWQGDTLYIHFPKKEKESSLLIKIGASTSCRDGSRKNMRHENPGWDFDSIRKQAFDAWNRELSVIEIPSASDEEKTTFYTALYHAFLVPWLTSDAGEKNTYSDFSFWDTFRTLHPLLTLLKPSVQEDMLLSIEEHYRRQGYLPVGPMTGYHVIPTILDSYIKGITSFSAEEMYKAMKECLTGKSPKQTASIRIYRQQEYLPDSVEHAVNTTLEYAYNDWALSQFASLTGKQEEAEFFQGQSYNYRNLFDVETLFMLPRHGSTFVREPGEMGYQESNKWTSSFFVPHNVQDLINLMGGDEGFISHLDRCYQDGPVLHDNEPVFHYPYLFAFAGRPDLTVDKIQYILANNYSNAPGGITGNDDLGSMSSWYVFSAMGIYPVCPGTDQYILTTPSFNEIILHLPGNKRFVISKEGKSEARYYSSLSLNGQPYKKLFITHGDLIQGGRLSFSLTDKPGDYSTYKRPYSLSVGQPDIQLSVINILSDNVLPGQENTLFFSLTNTGATGTQEVQLINNGQAIASRRIQVDEGQTISDSLHFKLYAEGANRLSVENATFDIHVRETPPGTPAVVCHQLRSESLIKSGDSLHISLTLQNVSGKKETRAIPVYLNDQVIAGFDCTLNPGEYINQEMTVQAKGKGFTELGVLDTRHTIKFYESRLESLVLALDFNDKNDSLAYDMSGFQNHGQLHGSVAWIPQDKGYSLQTGQGAYIEFPASESLMNLGNTLTLAAWIYPMERTRGYVDFFTKGDYTLLKMDNPETLSFFAGGWGRGMCQAKVPANWYNEWHHVAGVCTGEHIRLYIDGVLMQEIPVSGEIEYTEVPWNLGRNAEIPYSRFFTGQFENVFIFKEALTEEELLILTRD